ncbi:MAG: hypothetical protein SGPRY_011068 [Prymnesium sp.]
MRLAQPALLFLPFPRLPSPTCCQEPHSFGFSNTTLESLRLHQRQFVAEREWAQFHTPRSLALALVGEVGELCEILQWRGDDGARVGLSDWSEDERERLGEELADVLSYVIRLSDVAGIDLPAAALKKMGKNREKYPAERVRGSSAKLFAHSSLSRVVDTEYPREEQSGGSEGAREWGTPEWVASAYERAAARSAAQLESAGEVAPPENDSTSMDSAAAETRSDVDQIPNKIQPVPHERVAATAARMEAKLRAKLAGEQGMGQTNQDLGNNDTASSTNTSSGMEVESLEDLWSIMEFGESPDVWQ